MDEHLKAVLPQACAEALEEINVLEGSSAQAGALQS